MTISAPDPEKPDVATATFESVLFAPAATPAGLEETEAPDCLHDLNLDQVIDGVTASRPDFPLRPFFLALLDEPGAIEYRHEVLRDLEEDEIRAKVDSFAAGMRQVRKALGRAAGTYYRRQREAWVLQAVGLYRATVEALAGELAAGPGASVALRSLSRYLAELVEEPDFVSLGERQEKIAGQLAAIRYTIRIKGDRVQVDDFAEEIDYGEEIGDTFARFRQGQAKGYRFRYDRDPQMNHVEARIFDLVAKLNPEVFDDLERFASERADFADPAIVRLDRELQFYLAYLDHIEPLRRAGLSFCEPDVDDATKEIGAADTFDLALATKLAGEGETVVTNTWELSGGERIFVVSGPNQGGKTTFARTFGQLHYLARLGLSVPGREARLFLGDRIFTHFERQEDHSDLSGKLEDDLVRVRGILDAATTRSVVVMNESFSSTALEDARLLGTRVLERISELDLLCVYVTFVDELASLNEKVVSMTSTVDPDEPATRTFKVVRHPADGKAYAIAIAEKYRLTFDQLKGRIR